MKLFFRSLVYEIFLDFFNFLLISDLVLYIDFYVPLLFSVEHFLISVDLNRKSYKINQTIKTSSNHAIFSMINSRTKKLCDFRAYIVRLILYNKLYTINCIV